MTTEIVQPVKHRAATAAVVVLVFGAALWGRVPLAVVSIAVLLLAYTELRRLLVRGGSRISLVLALLVGRVVLAEMGRRPPDGATTDIGATVTAAGLVGVLGAHVLLVRAIPRAGARGVVVFVAIVAVGSAAGAIGDRFGRRRVGGPADGRTWEGLAVGVMAAALAGLAGGLGSAAPYDVGAGAVLGAIVGAAMVIGGVAGTMIVRGGAALPSAVVFRTASGPLLAAPAFYWAFRTLVL